MSTRELPHTEQPAGPRLNQMVEGLMWESEQHLTYVWSRAASKPGQCVLIQARVGMDALQTHLVQLVHRLETWSLGALAGPPAHDGGSWCRCGSDATRHRAEGSEQHRAKHHHGLPKVVMCAGIFIAHGVGEGG